MDTSIRKRNKVIGKFISKNLFLCNVMIFRMSVYGLIIN